jgi:hypothetical protein
MRKPRICVFAGPSLPPSTRPADPCFDWRAPATAGDLTALLEDPPDRLCLIDGYFDTCPSPWHKELLRLLAGGTRIFGASSMGALRAAELDRFGMIGVGAIYRAYRDGRLTGDDEVALIHAPERLGWAPLTVPMVEVRATLIAACRTRLIGADAARRLRGLAHDIHFAQRDWPAIHRLWQSEEILGGATCRRLSEIHVPLKQRDALACLAAAHADTGSGRVPPPPPPQTSFMNALQALVEGRLQPVGEVPWPRAAGSVRGVRAAADGGS